MENQMQQNVKRLQRLSRLLTGAIVALGISILLLVLDFA